MNFLFKIKIIIALFLLSEYANAHYSPHLGRFLSRDPIEERGGVNSHAFVRNDSLNHSDRLGLKFDVKWVGGNLADLGGSYAWTEYESNPVESGEDKIKSFVPKWGKNKNKCCAKVIKAKEFSLNVKVTIPDDLNKVATWRGRSDIRAHEARRVKALKMGYDAYLDKVDSRAYAKKCGTVCRDEPGEATELLAKYLVDLRKVAVIHFKNYDISQQDGIDIENLHWKPTAKDGRETGYQSEHIWKIKKPPAFNAPSCP